MTIRSILIALFLLASPAMAQQAVPPASDQSEGGRNLRAALLQDALDVVQAERKKAQAGHDHWIAGVADPVSVMVPHGAMGPDGQTRWRESLDTIKMVNARFYPDTPIDFSRPAVDVTQPHPNDPAGVSPGQLRELRRMHAHRDDALGKVDALIARMQAEIATLRAGLQ